MKNEKKRNLSREDITEMIFGIVHAANIKTADKREPVYTLTEMLSAKNITALRKLGKLHKISGFSKMDKPAIIPALTEKMTNSKILSELLFLLDKPEWELFKTASKTKQVTNDKLFCDNYRFLLELGIMGMYYNNDHFHYVIPSEIQKVYKEIEKTGFPTEKEHGDSLNDYAIAAVNLYGVISQDDFVALFNSQNSRKTDIDEMFGILIRFVSMDYGYCFWEDYIVNDDFEQNDFKTVEYYAKTAASKPRYIPSKQEFLKYSDWDYIEETPQLLKLRAYINHNLSEDADLTEDIIEEIYFLNRAEAKTQSYIDVFEEKEIFLEYEQVQTLLGLIFELRNNTRLWLNNGHTPDELFAEERKHLRPMPNGPIRVVKVGRNDPCPCGSGKKYKRCCGSG